MLRGFDPQRANPLYASMFNDRLFILNNCRAKIFEDIDRMINPDALLNRVVYDFDDNVKDGGVNFHGGNSTYNNHDVERLGRAEAPYDHLHFNSHFESGNLRKAIQVEH